jgi:hypothetical protein
LNFVSDSESAISAFKTAGFNDSPAPPPPGLTGKAQAFEQRRLGHPAVGFYKKFGFEPALLDQKQPLLLMEGLGSPSNLSPSFERDKSKLPGQLYREKRSATSAALSISR